MSAVKDKAQHAVIMDKTIQDRLNKDVQTYRLITTAVLVDRLKINGSLARKCLNELEEKGVIKKIVGHSKLSIYSEWPAVFGRSWTPYIRGKLTGNSTGYRCRVDGRSRVDAGGTVFSVSLFLCIKGMELKQKRL